jgi:hypothetical protein
VKTVFVILALVCAVRRDVQHPAPPPATQFVLPATMRDFDVVCLRRELENQPLVCRSAREVREFFATLKVSSPRS